MIPTSRPIRSLVTLVTALWTSLACCCALAGHHAKPEPVAAVATPVESAHACCESKKQQPPAGEEQPGRPGDERHECACGKGDRLVAHAADVEPVTKSSYPAPALDFVLQPLMRPAVDPSDILRQIEASSALPGCRCAPTLLAQHCQLIV